MAKRKVCDFAVDNIAVVCPSCQSFVITGYEPKTGSMVSCPSCKEKFVFGEGVQCGVVYMLRCPHCGEEMLSTDEYVGGRAYTCDVCGGIAIYPLGNNLQDCSDSDIDNSCDNNRHPGVMDGIHVCCPSCNGDVVLEREVHHDKYFCPYCGSEFTYNSGNVAPKGYGCLVNLIAGIAIVMVANLRNRIAVVIGAAMICFCVLLEITKAVSPKTVCSKPLMAAFQKIRGWVGISIMYVCCFLLMTLFSRFCDGCSREMAISETESQREHEAWKQNVIRDGGYHKKLTCDKCNGDFVIWLKASEGEIEYALNKKFRCPHCGSFKEVGFFD